MKKLIACLLAYVIFCSTCVAQFVHDFYPMGVIGIVSADELLNKNYILKKEGIKKITAYQTHPRLLSTLTSKTIFLNGDGNAIAIWACLPNRLGQDSAICTVDSFSYDHLGRMSGYKSFDVKREVSKMSIDYLGDTMIKYTRTNISSPDILVEYKYYNQVGQLLRVKHLTNNIEVANNALYYNSDGQVDSISHEILPLVTIIFTRTKRKKLTIIRMEDYRAQFKWVYNPSGQCMSSAFKIKNHSTSRNQARYLSKTEINYYYNTDGTLSKVTEKGSGKVQHGMMYFYSR